MLVFNKLKDNVFVVWFVLLKFCFKKWFCKKKKLNKKWLKYIYYDILNLIYVFGIFEDINNFYKIIDIYYIYDIK